MISAGRHIPPHRFADLAAGKLSDSERERIRAHEEECARCRRAHARIERVQSEMAEVRELEPPELKWDHIGARIYWVTSSERRAAARRAPARRGENRIQTAWRLAGRRPRALLLAGAGAAVLFAGALLWKSGAGETPRAKTEAPRPAESSPSGAGQEGAAPARQEPEALAGVVVFLQGEVEKDGAPLSMDDLIEPGARLTTRRGRVAVQFGDGSGFELGADSRALLRSFDDRDVELAVEGTIDVDLTHRAADQRFAIVAGEHSVLVRGTAFRVNHRERELGVSCLRGEVMVTDGRAEFGVAAGERLLFDLEGVLARGVRPMSEEEMAELERSLIVPMLPTWMEPESLLRASASLEVEARPERAVKVDGVEVGRGALALRVMSGRHHVTGLEESGRWIDLSGGAAATARLELKPPAEESAQRGSGPLQRRAELDEAMEESSRVYACLSSLRKRGLVEGSFVTFDIGIDPDGTQTFLNLVESNVAPEVERCLRSVVDAVEFPSGPGARLRYRLAF